MTEARGGGDVDVERRDEVAMARQLADNVPGALLRYVLLADGSDAVHGASARCADLWELAPERITADVALLWDLVEADDRSGLRDSLLQSARTLRPWHREWRINTPSGRHKWLQGSGRPQRQADGSTVWDCLVLDVTEHRQDDAPSRRDDRLQQVLAITKSALWEWQIDSDRVRLGSRWCELLGLGVEQLEPTMAGFMLRVHADDRAAVRARVQACLDQQVPYVSEHRLLHADGHVLWVEDRGGVLGRGADGAASRLLGCVVDISARRSAEAAWRHDGQRLQALLDNISCGVIVHGPDTHVIDANPAACRVTGLSLDQMRGRVALDPYWSFLEEDGSVMPLSRFPVPQVLARGAALNKLVLGVRRPDLARPVWVQVDAYPLHDEAGQISQIVVTFADITELKRAEDGARRLNRSLRVLSSGNIGLVTVTDEAAYLDQVCQAVVAAGGFRLSCVIFANRDAAKSARIAASAGPAADYLHGIQLSWDERLPGGRGPFGAAIRTGRTQVNQAWRTDPAMAPWRDLALRHGFESSIALPLTVSRQVVGILSLYAAEVDVFNPEELPPLEELARNISVAIETFRTRHQRDLAEVASRAKGEFLANMSHEIRTPLNAIVGLNYLMRRDGVTPEQAARLDKIDSASKHLLSLINDVLDLSKVESGRVVLETDNFHLSSVLDAVASIIAESARAKGLRVLTDANAVPLWLRGDATRLRQALLNYASNAVKFTFSGSITMRAKLLEDHGDELRVRFSVEDTGIGIAADNIPRLFQAFEQADASITRQFGGTGLGLAITRRLTTLMGGECGVDSQPGVGSSFWFTARLQRGHGILPATDSGPTGTAEALLRERHRGARILVAEDNEVNQEVLLAMLYGVGLNADVVANGQQAVTQAQSADYSLVLMDIQMPVMSGLAATRAIRALPGWQRRPILALTANAFDEDRQACRACGMDDFIVKPVDARALYTTLLRWLEPVGPAGGA